MVRLYNVDTENLNLNGYVLDGVTNAITGESTTKTVTENAVVDYVAANSGGGGVTDHTELTNIGTNAHSVIDTHLSSTDKHLTADAQTITGAKTFATSITLGSKNVTGIKTTVNGTSTADLVTESALVNYITSHL